MNGFGSMLKDYLDYYKISQTDFADRLNISVKHLNKIINGSASMSIELMLAISVLTDIDVNLILYVENKKNLKKYLYEKYKDEKGINSFLNAYYINELKKKNWITFKDEKSSVQKALDLLDYLGISSFDNIETYMKKRILYKKKNNADLNKIYLWIKRCDSLIADKQIKEYSSSYLKTLFKDLEDERCKPFNKESLETIFNNYGIYLVIEDALEGSKVRGCSLVKGTNPAIYITKYMHEKSSFYFTLYHELCHIKSDYNEAKNKIFICEDGLENEEKADSFAINKMIDPIVWNEIINSNNKDDVCKKNKIPLCFMYSRMAYEGKIKYSSKILNEHKEKI
jgi:HTH-type transcriptional regulator/antitoxin HigA